MDAELKEILLSLANKVDLLSKGQENLQVDIENIKQRTTKTDITIENIIEPKIQLLYEQQDSLAQKSDLVPIKEDIQEIRSDLDVVKHVVTEHSEKIRKLKNA